VRSAEKEGEGAGYAKVVVQGKVVDLLIALIKDLR